MNNSEKLWKYSRKIAVKIYFTNIISFTEITEPFQNRDLQLLQFDIRHKYRQYLS